MIDLHMHTTLSDEELKVEQLLEKLEQANVEVFSITDHNHALAYKHFNVEDYNVITGSEVATSFKGVIIEILLYNIDPDIINEWYYDFYSDSNLEKIEELLFSDIIELGKNNDYKVSDDLKLEKIEKGYAKKKVYHDLVSNNPGFPFETYKHFFRKGLSNPESNFFIDEGRTYPSIKEVVDLAKKAGGIAILAHPYEYGVNIDDLKQLVLDYNLDGMESFHPSATVVNSLEILDFCEANNLKSSMGSDYHKTSRRVPIGVHVFRPLLEYKAYNWIKELSNKS